jgi:VanZ family protein
MHVTPWLDRLRPVKRPVLGAYLAWVLGLTLLPLPAAAGALPHWTDKLVHLGLFVPLPVLVGVLVPPSAHARAAGWLASVGLAAAIEVVQDLLAFRTGDVWDFVWGAVGATIGWGAASCYDRVIRGAAG